MDYNLYWYEEPCWPESIDGLQEVARALPFPIATGERLTTKYEFGRVLENRAASILQMALGRVGGLTEAKKIAGMAETFYAQIAPHLYAGPVEGAANIHYAASLPNFLILESIEEWGGFHAEVLKKPILWQDGYVIPPSEPGLGTTFRVYITANVGAAVVAVLPPPPISPPPAGNQSPSPIA